MVYFINYSAIFNTKKILKSSSIVFSFFKSKILYINYDYNVLFYFLHVYICILIIVDK